MNHEEDVVRREPALGPTSTVKKSAAAMTSGCDFRNAFQVVARLGLGAIPLFFSVVSTAGIAMRCPVISIQARRGYAGSPS